MLRNIIRRCARSSPLASIVRNNAPLWFRLRGYATEAPDDVVIIGGGPGGYVAAIKAGQLGMKVSCIEKRGALGGTCLNVGCIPSKALLHGSHLYEEAKHYFPAHGIIVDNPRVDLEKLMAYKNKSVKGLTNGVELLFRKNKVNYVKGTGTITGPNEVTVTPLDGGAPQKISAKNIVIATGSDPIELPFLKFDEKRIVSSTGALSLPAVPKRMVVIGGGVIGLEMGSVWSRLGADVTVVEFTPRIAAGADGEVAKEFQKILQNQQIKFQLNTKVVSAKIEPNEITLVTEPAAGGPQSSLKTDVVLVSVGRRPYTDKLGLKEVGVKVDNRGRVDVDNHFRTNIPSIWAIGDVIRGPMLAHKAEEEGIAVIEYIKTGHCHVNYDAIPSVIYTYPEVAWVGKTEEELKEAKVEYRVGKFPFKANSRARTNDDDLGFIKFLTDAKTDRVLGCHMIGSMAGEMIAEATLAIEYGASAEDIARTCHAHPTLSEATKEAAMAAYDKPIHF